MGIQKNILVDSFDLRAFKTVTRTDKDKQAYV